MDITIKIPTLSQLTNFSAWDQSVGVFLALVIAAFFGAHVIMMIAMSGFMGGRQTSRTWVILNFLVGLALSLLTLSLSGSWFAGCAAAIVCYFVLGNIRRRAGG